MNHYIQVFYLLIQYTVLDIHGHLFFCRQKMKAGNETEMRER